MTPPKLFPDREFHDGEPVAPSANPTSTHRVVVSAPDTQGRVVTIMPDGRYDIIHQDRLLHRR